MIRVGIAGLRRGAGVAQVFLHHKECQVVAGCDLRTELAQARTAVQTLGATLHEQQTQLQQARGRLASLQALQEAAYGNDHKLIEAFSRRAASRICIASRPSSRSRPAGSGRWKRRCAFRSARCAGPS